MQRLGLHTRGGAVLLAAVIGVSACDGGAEVSSSETRLSTAAGQMLQAGGAQSSSPAAGTPLIEAPPEGEPIDIATLGFDYGPDAAPIRILEFSDFGCGYCRKFHMETFDSLRAEYVETGDVLWKHIPFIIGNWPNSIPATLAAECAMEQDRFAPMSEILFVEQSAWKDVSDPEAAVRELALRVGVEPTAFDTCMDNDAAFKRLQNHTQLAREVGVRSTPTFFVVGYTPIQGALPLEVWRQVMDTVLVADAAARAAAEAEAGN